MSKPRFSDAEKVQALRELEEAHYQAGMWNDPGDGPYALVSARAYRASSRMREILGLPHLTRVPPKGAE